MKKFLPLIVVAQLLNPAARALDANRAMQGSVLDGGSLGDDLVGIYNANKMFEDLAQWRSPKVDFGVVSPHQRELEDLDRKHLLNDDTKIELAKLREGYTNVYASLFVMKHLIDTKQNYAGLPPLLVDRLLAAPESGKDPAMVWIEYMRDMELKKAEGLDDTDKQLAERLAFMQYDVAKRHLEDIRNRQKEVAAIGEKKEAPENRGLLATGGENSPRFAPALKAQTSVHVPRNSLTVLGPRTVQSN